MSDDTTHTRGEGREGEGEGEGAGMKEGDGCRGCEGGKVEGREFPGRWVEPVGGGRKRRGTPLWTMVMVAPGEASRPRHDEGLLCVTTSLITSRQATTTPIQLHSFSCSWSSSKQNWTKRHSNKLCMYDELPRT